MMSHSNGSEPTSTLSEAIDRQIAAMDSLRLCLEDENRALQLRDPEQLLSIAERKMECLKNAGRISRQCQELEVGEGAQTSAASGDFISRQREQLDLLTRLCRELNTANGTLIRRQKIRTETTLQILRGEPERSNVYGPSGTTTGRSSAQRLLVSI